jgi:hypothetical protein
MGLDAPPTPPVSSEFMDAPLGRLVVFLATSLVGMALILTRLPEIASPLEGRTCIQGGWKLGLIVAHTATFVLIPVAMRVFQRSLTALGQPPTAIFASLLGLSFVMVSIASEIGWHVTQCWYYQDQFSMLNFMFYFFLLSAFALWGDGLQTSNSWLDRVLGPYLNLFFAACLVGISFLYLHGNEVANPGYKVPIYITLTLIFAVLTYRAYNLLKTPFVLLFPLFSVGVNLSFVFLLQRYGGDPYADPNVPANAIFHILHDVAGTEAGVAIFTWLVYRQGKLSLEGQLLQK